MATAIKYKYMIFRVLSGDADIDGEGWEIEESSIQAVIDRYGWKLMALSSEELATVKGEADGKEIFYAIVKKRL